MSGSAVRCELGRLTRLAGWPAGRGARFLREQAGKRAPDVATLLAAPRWPALAERAREAVAMVALLIAGQSTLARLIEGARLRRYAALVGDTVLERILSEGEGGAEPLPPPETLVETARTLLAAATRDDAAAAAQLFRAERFLRDIGAWPSI